MIRLTLLLAAGIVAAMLVWGKDDTGSATQTEIAAAPLPASAAPAPAEPSAEPTTAATVIKPAVIEAAVREANLPETVVVPRPRPAPPRPLEQPVAEIALEIAPEIAPEPAPELVAEPAPETAVELAVAPEAAPETSDETREPLELAVVRPAAALNGIAPIEPGAENPLPAPRVISAPSARPVLSADETKILEVTGNSVNLRAGPSTGRDIVGRLSRGDKAELVAEAAEGWLQIRDLSTGTVGFMAARFLAPADPG